MRATAVDQFRRRHVVEQHHLRAGVEGLVELRKRVDLDLDRHHVTRMRSRSPHRGPDAPGSHDVVVLDQDRIVEPEAMVDATAAAHGVLLERTQPRRGLARVGNARSRAGHGIDQPARRRRNPAEVPHEVERRALCRQDAARRAGQPGDDGASLDAVAIGSHQLDADAGIDLPACLDEERQARDDTGATRHQHGARLQGRPDRRGARDVAGTAEILGQRTCDGVADDRRGHGRDHRTPTPATRAASNAMAGAATGSMKLRCACSASASG